ncbi:recombinase family protein [Caulobacter sp. ErkDOM-YI]|uniref:recombinase family protein n=1 Tax=unclassified Caulobacter TaxID=2648921 RepID=UPI003AF92E9F
MSQKLRCAIYTRKSSEEGLDQSFNSLHAQREACEAYVLSQAGEGWSALRTTYDDGGFSGGSMERPGLAQLLSDIAAGKIDVVVVYKVDRLTRSLADFAKIVETFDARGVSFVSVTQAFNTTNSMGRLTLNVLLSFAQFEREVTGERIRDKIAASKAKGMWMGGTIPLGYDLRERKLIINLVESELVRDIFARYLAGSSAASLAEDLERAGVRSKAWTTRAGRPMGGKVMGKGAIVHILQSRLYLGEIVHKGQVHTGEHEAIISREVFDTAAAQMAARAALRRSRPSRAVAGPLKGRLFDGLGQPMSPSFAYGKAGKLHRYYIAMALQRGVKLAQADGFIRRVSAPAVEGFLVGILNRISTRDDVETADLQDVVHRVELRADETHLIIDSEMLFPGENPELVLAAVRKALVEGEQAVAERGQQNAIRLVLPQRLQLRGGRTSIRGGSADERPRRINPGLVNALKRAHAYLLELKASPFSSREDLQSAVAPATQHDRQVCRLALMSPDIQRQILVGDQPAGMTLRNILKTPMPLAWADQMAWLETISRG